MVNVVLARILHTDLTKTKHLRAFFTAIGGGTTFCTINHSATVGVHFFGVLFFFRIQKMLSKATRECSLRANEQYRERRSNACLIHN